MMGYCTDTGRLAVSTNSKKNRLKPRWGGMELPRSAHAAPLGLGRVVGRGVALNRCPHWPGTLVRTGRANGAPNNPFKSCLNAETGGRGGSQRRDGLWSPRFSAIFASRRSVRPAPVGPGWIVPIKIP
jgi:hypothetical protein